MQYFDKFLSFFIRAVNNIVAAVCIFAVLIIAAEYMVWDYLPLWLHLRLAIVLILGFITGIIAGWNLKEGWGNEENI